MRKHNAYTWVLFILPSLLGIFLFMTPIKVDGVWKVTIAILANELAALVSPFISWFALIIIGIAALGSVIYLFLPKTTMQAPGLLRHLFHVNLFWTIVRVIAFIFTAMVVFDFGPEAINNENTAGLLMNPDEGLVTFLLTIFFFAGTLLPLLTNFGLLEFIGTLTTKIMRPLFKIPGRSSIDALASWIGDGTIGVLMTNKQYESGNYTKREAAILASTFSIVSITFCFTILKTLNLEGYFFPFFGTITITGLILAFIMPRIYPLRKIPDTYIDGSTERKEEITSDEKLLTIAKNRGLEAAHHNRNPFTFLKEGFRNVLDMWIAVTPVVMAFGTIALVLAEFTPTFAVLGKPFEPLLAMLGIPEAGQAAQTMVIGFADMLLPAVLGSGIESEMTRFFIGAVSVVQLIYMSEVGGLILGTKIPLKFLDLVVIFLLRTLIALPIVALFTHLLF